MVVGIGIDLVDLDDMASALEKQPQIYRRILTDKEIEVYETLNEKRKLEFLAGRFAAKEAFGKAMGTGIGAKVTFGNVTVLNNEKGQAMVVESPFDGNIFISISHTKQMAIAQVVLEKIL